MVGAIVSNFKEQLSSEVVFGEGVRENGYVLWYGLCVGVRAWSAYRSTWIVNRINDIMQYENWRLTEHGERSN